MLFTHLFPGRSRAIRTCLTAVIIVFWYAMVFWIHLFVFLARGRHRQLEDSLPTATILLHLLKLGLIYGVKPGAYVQLRLDLHDPSRWSGFIFPQEQQLWHENYSAPRHHPDRLLLHDKIAFSDIANAHGIPAVKTLRTFPRGSLPGIAEITDGQSVFIKPAHGHGLRGCFVLTIDSGQRQISGHDMNREFVRSQLEADIQTIVHSILQSDDLLVQEILVNHPVFDGIENRDTLATLRIITERVASEPKLRIAMLELPQSDKGNWSIWPIDPDTGKVSQHTGISALPDWSCCCELVDRSHQRVPGLRTVAWDLALTAAGPVLIEGNVIWNVSTPQNILGQSAFELDIYRGAQPVTSRLPSA